MFKPESISQAASTAFSKLRQVCEEKAESVKAYYCEPEFLGCDNPKMPLADDGTKCCFMFNAHEPAKQFAGMLSKQIGTKVDRDNYIGYDVLYVPAEKYEEAIQRGINNLMVTQNGWWVNFYDERSCYDFEQLLALKLHPNYIDKNKGWNTGTEIIVKMWITKLESILGTEVIIDKKFSDGVNIGIKRGIDSHLTHDELINKIRCADLLKQCPFSGYAYTDFYGKYIR